MKQWVGGAFWRFAKELLQFRKLVAVAITTIVLSTVLSLFPPYVIGVAIDQHIVSGHVEDFLQLVMLYIALIVALWVLQTIRGYAIEALGQLVAYSQRVKLFSKLLDLRIGFYKDKNVGDLVSRIINGTTTVVDVFVLGLLNTIGDVVTLIGALAVMIMISPALTLISIASISPMVVVIRVLGARMRSTYRDVRMRIGVLTSIVEESFFGVEAIKVFNREKSFVEYFAKESLATTKRAVQAALLGGMFWSSVGFISTLSTVSIIVVGGYLVTTGITSVGIVVAFTQCVARFTGPINNIAGLYDRLQLALASLERIYDVLDSEDVELDEGVEVERLRGEIVFENVWFEYVKGRPVLKNVSFRVSPGEVVAIVGPTGAGKTTLTNLLLRFYEPTQGRITIDGIDIRALRRSCLRKRISYVPQEAYLFPGTIMDNIRVGKPGASDEEVVDVCKKLSIHEFIERLPNGYHTDVGEAGKRLSQGERQLIAIARAMLRDPDIVILDEATSSIDPYTEELLRRAIKRLMAGRTGIIIVHRLSTARECDKVIVVEEGVIGEAGEFKELLRKRGAFYKLYTTQMRVAEFRELP
jgi:ATP-binding cassette subfamily B protein